jgi:hypothetical protein
MILVVSDANIFIDLLKMGLVNHFFQIAMDIRTTDLIIEEVREDNVEYLMNYVNGGRLKVREFSFEELIELARLNECLRGLSMADCSCIWLCHKISATLLTSDRKLTAVAEEDDIETHGLLWILDKMISDKVVTSQTVVKRLETLMQMNPRLPEELCDAFIKRWRADKG